MKAYRPSPPTIGKTHQGANSRIGAQTQGIHVVRLRHSMNEGACSFAGCDESID